MSGRITKYGIFISAVAVSFAALVSYASDGEAFTISGKIKESNEYPVAAVNGFSGDVLVVWQQLSNGMNDSTIYCALCKKTTSGFKVLKPKPVSNPKSGFASNYGVAYNPEDNSYVVIWESSANYEYTILSRKIQASGKPARKINQVTFAGYSDYSPAIANSPSEPGSPPAAKGGYLAAFHHHPKTGNITGDKPGLYTISLDQNGAPSVSGLTIVRLSNYLPDGRLDTSHDCDCLVRAADGGFYLGYERKPDKGSDEYIAHVAKLSAGGTLIKDVQFSQKKSDNIGIIQLKKKLFLATWEIQEGTWDFADRLFKPTPKPIKGEFKPLSGATVDWNCFVKLEDDPGAVQFSSASGSIYGTYIKATGKPSASTAELIVLDGVCAGMAAACLPGSNTVMLTWGEYFPADDNAEIKGQVFGQD